MCLLFYYFPHSDGLSTAIPMDADVLVLISKLFLRQNRIKSEPLQKSYNSEVL